MEQEMILISKDQVQLMLNQLHLAEGYCRNAQPMPPWDSGVDIIEAHPCAFYPGANGYAGATMRDVICTLESHL